MNVVLREIAESDLELIMKWRMSPDITKWMNTDPVLTLEGQKNWLAKIKTDSTVWYRLVIVDNQPAGVINLADIDMDLKKASWGYYVGEHALRSIDLAISLEWNLYEYVFETLHLNCLQNEVFSLNRGVIKLHQICGSAIDEVVKDGVSKNGKSYDVTVMSITKAMWEEKKKDIEFERYTIE